MGLSLTAFATHLVSNLGYAGLTIGLLLDSFGVPIPSEVLIPLTVVAGGGGRFDLWLVVLLSVAAQSVGGLVSYLIGRIGGLPALERYGRYLLIAPADIERGNRFFARYGPWCVGVGRCIPVVRGFVGYPAGIARMPVLAFLGWTALGAAVWSGILIGAGELWRSDVLVINRAIDKVSWVVIGLLVVAAGLHVRRVLRSGNAHRGGGRDSRGDGRGRGRHAGEGSQRQKEGSRRQERVGPG
ncbi:MAG: DedA family protein [Acidimicrobiaceae bacterium]|nr:DedA family protein [Acidimicrobiaceae bacterium]MBO0747092.1 DedA family protein [Acidimicrobiaceae bacterium]